MVTDPLGVADAVGVAVAESVFVRDAEEEGVAVSVAELLAVAVTLAVAVAVLVAVAVRVIVPVPMAQRSRHPIPPAPTPNPRFPFRYAAIVPQPLLPEACAANVIVSDAGAVIGPGYVTTIVFPPTTETQPGPQRLDDGEGGDETVQPAGSGIVNDVTKPHEYETASV